MSMSMSKEEMVKKLDGLISEGNKRIGDQKEDRAILILGETGAGKSTLTHLFAGKTLEAEESEEGDMVINAPEPVPGVQISHKKISETKIPAKITSASGLVVWDCPGFSDLGRDPIQDIANAFYIQRLFETTKELKFVLVVPEHNTKGRGENLLRVVDHFVRIFKDISEIKDSVSLVVTQAPIAKKSVHIKATLENILRDNQTIEPQSRMMLEYLLKSVEVFNTPKEAGVISKMLTSMFGGQAEADAEDSILASIDSNTKYLTTSSGSANVVISRNSETLASDLFENVHEMLFRLLATVSDEITTICSKVNHKGNEMTISGVVTSQETAQQVKHGRGATLMKWVTSLAKSIQSPKDHSSVSPAKVGMPAVPPSYKELLNLDSILAFEAFCDLAIRPGPNIQDWLGSLEDAISGVVAKINQYGTHAAAAATEYEHHVMPIDYRIKEIIKYLLFLSKVWSGKNIEPHEIIAIFTSCKKAVETAALKGAEDFTLSATETGEEYYNAAIQFLDRYPDNPKCKISKSNAYFYIARIQGSNEKSLFGEMISHCIKSIELNPDTTTNVAYDLIDQLCKKDNARLALVVGVQQSGILDYLFVKNNQAIIDSLFSSLNQNIAASLHDKMDNIQSSKKDAKLMKFIDLSLEIRGLIISICSGQISAKIDSLNSDTANILSKIGSNISKKDIASLIHYLESINLTAKHKYDAKIDTWKDHFDILQVEKNIVEMVKSMDLTGKHEMKYFMKAIEYTSLPIVDQVTAIRLDQDRECINKMAEANYHIGEQHQSARAYGSAVEYYVKAIQLSREVEGPYRKLDEIYFIHGSLVEAASAGGAIVQDTTLLQKLLAFNYNELTAMLNKKLLNFVVDYKGTREHFHQCPGEAHVAALQYLENLTNLSQIIARISDLSTSRHIDHVEFIGCLSQIARILGAEFTNPQVVHAASHNVCESVIKCPATDLFEIARLTKQIEYIAYLGSISPEIDGAAKQMIADSAKLVSGLSDMVSSILRYTQAIELNYDEISSEYYERVSEYVEKYPEDKICVKIHTHAYLRLAEIATTSQEKIEYYQETIRLNAELLRLCQGVDNEFYATYSVKRKACERLGDLYFEDEDLEAALEQFQLIDQHVKVKKTFEKLISMDPDNYALREQQADYFAKKAMIGSAVDTYAEALSLTSEFSDHSRINMKIAATLASVSSKSTEFKSRADSIVSTKIVYFVDNMIYDNPLLNHPSLVREFTKIYGSNATSKLIGLTSELSLDSGYRDFIEDRCQGADALISLGILVGETPIHAL